MSEYEMNEEYTAQESDEEEASESDTECRCVLCGLPTDAKTAPILTMGHYGEPRYLCPNCAAELDDATLARDPEDAEAAIAALGKKIDFAAEDYAASEELNRQLIAAAERVKKIREGTYDFADDEHSDGGIEDIPEELRESEEDRELDRKEAESLAKFDKVSGIVLLVAVAVVAAILILRFFFG